MKDSDKYDVNEAPVSGPFAGLDPEQAPVIVDKDGQKVRDDPNTPAEATATRNETRWDYLVVDALATLAETHNIQIETGAGKPVHRIVLGEGNFREHLASSLDAALLHHKEA
jgi:hypothetical protein